MRRFVIAVVLLFMSVSAATVNDCIFHKRLSVIQGFLEKALTLSIEGESEDLAELTEKIQKEIDKNRFICTLTVPSGEYESLQINVSRLYDCLRFKNTALYTELCSESLRQLQQIKEGSKLNLNNII